MHPHVMGSINSHWFPVRDKLINPISVGFTYLLSKIPWLRGWMSLSPTIAGFIILPTQTRHYQWEPPQNYHRFAACLIPPKWVHISWPLYFRSFTSHLSGCTSPRFEMCSFTRAQPWPLRASMSSFRRGWPQRFGFVENSEVKKPSAIKKVLILTKTGPKKVTSHPP